MLGYGKSGDIFKFGQPPKHHTESTYRYGDTPGGSVHSIFTPEFAHKVSKAVNDEVQPLLPNKQARKRQRIKLAKLKKRQIRKAEQEKYREHLRLVHAMHKHHAHKKHRHRRWWKRAHYDGDYL